MEKELARPFQLAKTCHLVEAPCKCTAQKDQKGFKQESHCTKSGTLQLPKLALWVFCSHMGCLCIPMWSVRGFGCVFWLNHQVPSFCNFCTLYIFVVCLQPSENDDSACKAGRRNRPTPRTVHGYSRLQLSSIQHPRVS